MLFKFDSSQLTEASLVLGSVSFSLFIIFIDFICMSMFISIIIDSFRRARQNINDKNQQVFSFMLNKFQRWIGTQISFNRNNFIDYFRLEKSN